MRLHRILVVDNYDSFTYNLVHSLKQSASGEVSVVLNDDSDFLSFMNQIVLKEHFDLIVLSPGPGNPYDDVGCVTAYIIEHYLTSDRNAELPVLFGVCMGYEAIGVRCGVTLVKTVPRHGVRWPIHLDHHADSQTLFAGLPDVVEQVRYHSLILDPSSLASCEELTVTSYAYDVNPGASRSVGSLSGPRCSPDVPQWVCNLSLRHLEEAEESPMCRIPMSFRHKRLPIFAVQFHPESIWSDFGPRMIANMVDLSGNRRPIALPRTVEAPSSHGRQQCRLVHTVLREDMEWWTEAAFSNLFFCEKNTSVWLDSPKGTTGRWSFMTGGGQIGRLFAVLTQRDGRTTVTEGGWPFGSLTDKTCQEMITDVFETIRVRFGAATFPQGPPISVPAIFTFLGYEAAGQCNLSPRNEVEAVSIIADRILAIDNDTGNVFALHLDSDEWPVEEGLKALIKPEAFQDTSRGSRREPVFVVRDSKSQYMEKVKCCQLAIEEGESYELCLTTSISGIVNNIDPLHTYCCMRRLNPAPNSAFFHVPRLQLSLLMASPERFLRIADGVAQVKPIKGTRARGRSPSEDAGIVTELSESVKDSAENLMIVDLVRNDLSLVCDQVECPALMQVETYAPYHQLVSTVEGTITRGKIPACIFALFPAGSMTGAPKRRSIQLLEAIEGQRRGPGYSGAVGVCSPATDFVDLAVCIRAMTIRGESGRVSLGVGGAVLAVSDPIEEWREMILKAKRNLAIVGTSVDAPGILLKYGDTEHECLFVRSAGFGLKRSNPVTTMRYERGRGVWLWQGHLRRLADELGTNEVDIAGPLIQSIEQAANQVNEKEFSKFQPVTEGPFVGISESGWTNISFGNLHASIIRSEAYACADGEIKFVSTLTPLEYENITTVRLTEVRVDSADAAMRHKTADWYVSGISAGTRPTTIIADECDSITETGIANVAVFTDGEWRTPTSSSSAFLPGLMRQHLMEGGHMREARITIDDLRQANQIIAFNSVRGVFSIHLE